MVRSGVAFDLTARSAAVEGTVLPLTRSEYAICEYLALHAGQTFTKEQIYEAVFGIDGTADDTAVTQHIEKYPGKAAGGGRAGAGKSCSIPYGAWDTDGKAKTDLSAQRAAAISGAHGAGLPAGRGRGGCWR